MKNIFSLTVGVSIIILLFGAMAIGQDSTYPAKQKENQVKPESNYGHENDHMTAMKDSSQVHGAGKVRETSDSDTAKTDTSKEVDVKVAASIKEIIASYLQLKNALVSDKSGDASTAGRLLETAFEKVDVKELTSRQKKIFADVSADAREHAEHIGANEGNIEHQREHFELLSNDMVDLVREFGSGQTLYKDFCPMYNDKKGAIWLSETKVIKNPYYGKQMPTCGSVKETLQ